MGTYSFSEYLDTFGGLPERGETFPDDPDALREEYTENDRDADAAMDRQWVEDHEFDDPDLERD